jgi:hypothetical protein
MKPSIYSLWWNPWDNSSLDFNKKVSISIDNLTYDKNSDVKILFLAEPKSITPHINEGAYDIGNEFDKIFTYQQFILDKFPHAEKFVWGSTWLDFNDLKEHKKSHITFVTSSKSQSDGHRFRHQIYQYLDNIDETNGMDVYSHISPPFHERRNDFFEKALFHIAVENSAEKNWFTEKIIDCFATKTVPIYWGCPNIGDWFDTDGIITFDTIEELNVILKTITTQDYENRIKSIEDNFERCKNFYGENDVFSRITKRITEFVNNGA